MYYYDDTEGRGSKIKASIALLIYAVSFAALMIFVSFTVDMPNQDQGILVNFGNTEEAGGDVDLALSEQADQPSAPTPQSVQSDEQLLTTTDQNAPAIVQKPKEKPKAQEVVKSEPQPRTVNQKALFPGRTEGSTSKSEGISKGTGNQGVPNGSPDGAHTAGGGTGTSGVSFSLSGRSPIGTLGKPAYNGNDEGRVVIRIVVNARGEVTSAEYSPKGSTTDRSTLVEAARRTALKSRFTAADEGTVQEGTITYIFKLN